MNTWRYAKVFAHLWKRAGVNMKIREVSIKNFGRLSNKTICFEDGINIIYGENESGKSTVHTFMKSMLFGLERGRGRAANNDTFTQYEPWENPNYYAGIMKIESGGKVFCINRNFDKYSKTTNVFCQDDGEELSIEDGDLDILLDDMTESIYENTVSIGQLRAEPAQPLSIALKNYATNCYTSGGGDLDQAAAMDFLKKRKKEIQKEIEANLQAKREKRERFEMESSYVWRDVHKLRDELEEIEKEIEMKKIKEEEREDDPQMERKKVRLFTVVLFLIGLAISLKFLARPWNYLLAIIIVLGLGNYVWSRLKVGKKQVKTESEKLLEEISGESETLEKLFWEKEHIQADLKEKQTQYENLQEQLEELEVLSDVLLQLEQKKLAVNIAEARISALAKKMQSELKDILNEKASRILAQITNQKYNCINIEETLKMHVMDGDKLVDVERLSRGTLEQIYFAIRMAATELLQKEEQPVILDDTFVYYDDERLKNTLKWLAQNKKQVIILTCQKREMQALDSLGIKYNV